jgi:hypothetical protein
MAGEFDKDFGYLMPFLDKVAAAAASVADPAARAELARLVADEKAKWSRIRELLGGAAARPVAAPVAGNSPSPQAPVASAAHEPFSLTVGSLRPKRN